LSSSAKSFTLPTNNPLARWFLRVQREKISEKLCKGVLNQRSPTDVHFVSVKDMTPVFETDFLQIQATHPEKVIKTSNCSFAYKTGLTLEENFQDIPSQKSSFWTFLRGLQISDE